MGENIRSPRADHIGHLLLFSPTCQVISCRVWLVPHRLLTPEPGRGLFTTQRYEARHGHESGPGLCIHKKKNQCVIPSWWNLRHNLMATMDLLDVSLETDQIKEWRSIVTLIVFFLASKHAYYFPSMVVYAG